MGQVKAKYTELQQANLDSLKQAQYPLVQIIKLVVAQCMGIDEDDADVNDMPQISISAEDDWLVANIIKSDSGYVYAAQLFATGTHIAFSWNYSDMDETSEGQEIGFEAIEEIAMSAIAVDERMAKFVDDIFASPLASDAALKLIGTWRADHLF